MLSAARSPMTIHNRYAPRGSLLWGIFGGLFVVVMLKCNDACSQPNKERFRFEERRLRPVSSKVACQNTNVVHACFPSIRASRGVLQEINLNIRTTVSGSILGFSVVVYAAYKFLWTISESCGSFIDICKLEGYLAYTVFVVISIIIGLYMYWPKRRIEIQMPGSDSSFEVKFGDIFEGEGVIVIPVNEYFDSELGGHVSETSLHGQFIRDILGGQSDTFERRVDESLQSNNVRAIPVKRNSGRTLKYPIGTVAKVDDKRSRRFLLAALSRTDIQTLKASATSDELWDCLAGIWNGIRDYHNGNAVRIPLIGSGLSSVGLPARILIGIIITSFFYHTKRGKIAGKVTLVLPDTMKGKMDLTTIERSWK